MDFIMDHSSLFLSVGVIMLLALIGYYADKNDSKIKNKEKTSKNTSKPSTGKDEVITKSESTSDDVKNNIMDSFSQLPQDIPSVPVSDNGVWGDVASIGELNSDENVEDLTPEINNVTVDGVSNITENINNNGYYDVSQDIPVINNVNKQEIPVVDDINVQDSLSDSDEPVIPFFDNNAVEMNQNNNISDDLVINAEPEENQNVEENVNISNTDDGILKNVPVESVVGNVFDSSSFENTGMSLDDLEKKNYEKIVNNIKEGSSDEYNNFDDSGIDEFISGSNTSESADFLSDVPKNESPDIESTIEQSNVESPVVENFQSNDSTFEDSEHSSDIQSVPELNDDSVVSSDFNSSNNDIWKF